MKKLLFLCLAVTLLSGCQEKQDKARHVTVSSNKQTDSLTNLLAQKDKEINNMMGTLNEIQECFRVINETEDRLTLAKNSEGIDREAFIMENMSYIQKCMRQNRQLIQKLREQVKKSSYDSDQLRKTVADYLVQLANKDKEINLLRAQLTEKDIQIRELDDKLDRISDDLNAASRENTEKAQTIASDRNTIEQQDKKLNEGFYVFGTKKELNTQQILDGSKLIFSESTKDYFTKIDIRIDNEIKLYSKSARILTHHPAGSYSLQPDAKGMYVLKILDAVSFWRTSKYLVIMVK
ncbi:MAG: hypothetical protein KBS94_01275 [Prevotella sp.]|nr:hypothetical protein [Candidatus Equicola faecalis]